MKRPLNDKERIERVLDAVGMGTWSADFHRNTMEWDSRMHDLFGPGSRGFGGTCDAFFALVEPDDREWLRGEIEAALKSGTEYDGEFHIVRTGDGQRRVMRMRMMTGYDGNVPGHASGVCWDVTERRLMEEDLIREHYLFQALMEHLPDSIYFKDLSSRFVAVNKAKALKHGYADPDDLIGKTDEALFKEEHVRKAMEDERRIISGEIPFFSKAEKLMWPDGRVTWASTTKLPLSDSAGKIIGTFGLSRDVTEQKLAEEKLAKFTDELRRRNESLEEDLRMARELQNAMLPPSASGFQFRPKTGDDILQFHHFFNPSMQVSGDFFDIFKISDNKAGVFICDVMGHGVRAALVTAMLHTLVSEPKATRANPSELLDGLNRMLRDALKNLSMPVFASAFYLVADLEKGEMSYANAGHPHPLRLRGSKAGADLYKLNGARPGPALGLFDNALYTNCSCDLKPQDLILLFTDGLFEVEDSGGHYYDYQSLFRAVQKRRGPPAYDLCREVIDEVRHFSATEQFTDDMCLVAMEVSSAA